ncbi:unnamed protein product, partial [Allacma fusca]
SIRYRNQTTSSIYRRFL